MTVSADAYASLNRISSVINPMTDDGDDDDDDADDDKTDTDDDDDGDDDAIVVRVSSGTI